MKVSGTLDVEGDVSNYHTSIALVFISEITARAFIIADSNKRRTLSRSDIAKALGKSDQFDFLIDIVPRDDAPLGVPGSAQHTLNLGVGGSSSEQGRRGQVDGSGRDQASYLSLFPCAYHRTPLVAAQVWRNGEWRG